jgi:hypothetical protein
VKEGDPVPGAVTGPPCHCGTNTETLSSRLGPCCDRNVKAKAIPLADLEDL